MSTLTQASAQWASRPDDERFLSLHDLRDHCQGQRDRSKAVVATTRNVEAFATDRTDPDAGLLIHVDAADAKGATIPTNWSFGQLAQLAKAPAGYLRQLPAALAADCINAGLLQRDVEEVGTLLRMDDGGATLAAATGPNYGRIWNAEIADALVRMFGDGITGDWRVPGEFGREVTVNKSNTTLYAGDRNMFVFLTDERNKVELPNRRNGESGELSRGFFMWNSEVGDCTFGIGTFYFDYVCMNRIVWGAQEYREVKIRHTKGARYRFQEQVRPILTDMSKGDATPIISAIEAARLARKADMREWLAKRFNPTAAAKYDARHLQEEGRPIESLWDATVAMTAVARDIPYQDQRVKLEREAAAIMALAA